MGIDPELFDPETHLCEETQLVYNALSDRLGKELAKKAILAIVEGAGGIRVWLNAAEPIAQQHARIKAIDLIRQGMGVLDIVKASGLTAGQVMKLMRSESEKVDRTVNR